MQLAHHEAQKYIKMGLVLEFSRLISCFSIVLKTKFGAGLSCIVITEGVFFIIAIQKIERMVIAIIAYMILVIETFFLFNINIYSVIHLV
jgi:hypothetical protein